MSWVLALLCMPLVATVPRAGLDPSWHLGLSLVHPDRIAAGPGFVFNYGPLGFLAKPNVVWLPGALLGLVYAFATAFALSLLVCRSLQDWLAPVPSVAITVLFVLCAVQTESPPEIATAALTLWGLTLIRPSLVRATLPRLVPVAFGAAAALQLLVKFSVGGATIAAALIVVTARPPRLRNVVVLASSFVVWLVALWVAAGQTLGDLTTWLKGSLGISRGYSSAMAAYAGFDGAKYWVVWLIVALVLGLGLWQLVSQHHGDAIPFLLLVVVAGWFFTKAGFVRLSPSHATVTYLGFAVLIAAVPWGRRRIPVALVALAVALGAIVLADEATTLPSKLSALVSQPGTGLAEAERIVRAAAEPSYRTEQLEAARSTIREQHPITEEALAALRGQRVHADPTGIAIVWAYDLAWEPVPVFQTYQANTHALDLKNARRLGNPDGPNAVIRERATHGIDARLAAWESPTYMVELTCRFEVVAQNEAIEVLHRASDACDAPVPLATDVVLPGAKATVPRPQNPESLVVATIDYPIAARERLATALLKPTRLPLVYVDGEPTTFLTGTAESMHLLHVPATIGGRLPTNAGLDIRSLQFANAPGDVRVRYYEIPPR